MTLAFVFSGGGNYGALQAGAVEVLLQHGYHPDLLLGVSAGALNAAWLANNPTLAGVEQLQRIWRIHAPRYLPPFNKFRVFLRLVLKKESLLSNQPLEKMLRILMRDHHTFGDYSHPRLYTVAARFPDGAPYVFGDNPKDRLLDGLMSSTALPPLFPPWQVDGVSYVDGGAASGLPLLAAIERGASEIFALNIRSPLSKVKTQKPTGIITTSGQILSAMVDRFDGIEIHAIRFIPGIRLHLVNLWPESDPGFWNFQRAEEMIADGKKIMAARLVEEIV